MEGVLHRRAASGSLVQIRVKKLLDHYLHSHLSLLEKTEKKTSTEKDSSYFSLSEKGDHIKFTQYKHIPSDNGEKDKNILLEACKLSAINTELTPDDIETFIKEMTMTITYRVLSDPSQAEIIITYLPKVENLLKAVFIDSNYTPIAASTAETETKEHLHPAHRKKSLKS